MDSPMLLNMFIFLLAACVVVPVASRFKLGPVLGYILAGLIIGPSGAALIRNPEEIMHFAEFGVVMMLFVIGLELEPSALWRLRKHIIGLGGAQVAITAAGFTALGSALGFGWQTSLAVGLALSLSSTALVLRILQERNLMHTDLGEKAFSILLFQDIAVIPILIAMPLLSAHGVGSAPHGQIAFIESLPGWAHALLVISAIALLVAGGRYLSHGIFGFIARTHLREVFTALALALLVGVTLLMQVIGVSPALGAFVAGVVLANSDYKHTLESDIEPFKGLLLGLFFIAIGMGMDTGLLMSRPLDVLGGLGALLFIKFAVLALLGRLSGMQGPQGIGFGLALSQGGEFSFVLFQYMSGLGILPGPQAEFATLCVALSMAATPLLLIFYRRYIQGRFVTMLPQREYDTIEAQDSPVIIAGFGRYGQIIGRFMRAQGVEVTVLEKNPDQIELLRKFGQRGYFGDASRMDLLRAAGAEKAKLLIIAIDDADKCVEIAAQARAEFPRLRIFARARNRRHAYELYKAGVDYFRRETFDSSLVMAQEAMKLLGHRAFAVRQKALLFARHDEKTMLQSFEFFEKEPELISFSRQAGGELERILQQDTLQEGKAEPDQGWG